MYNKQLDAFIKAAEKGLSVNADFCPLTNMEETIQENSGFLSSEVCAGLSLPFYLS